MGLNRHTKGPAGFVSSSTICRLLLDTVSRITGLVLDDRPLRAELTPASGRAPVRCAVYFFHIIDMGTNPIHQLLPTRDETTKTKLPWHRGDPPHARSFRVRVRSPSPSTTQYGRGQSGGQVRDDRRVARPGARRPAVRMLWMRRRRGAGGPGGAAAEGDAGREEAAARRRRRRSGDDGIFRGVTAWPRLSRGSLCCGAGLAACGLPSR